jgi:hypothetical protein
MGVGGNTGGGGGGGGTGGIQSPDDIATVRMTVRAARSLLRALTTGNPMTGPDVIPLIQELTNVLNTGSPKKNGKGKGG